MALKINFKQFLDDKGKVLDLTEQAKTVFEFLSKIVFSVSEHIEQPEIDVDLKCNTRADGLSCDGSIKARCATIDIIDWHCDTCEACGTISGWSGTLWDRQERTLH